MSATFDFPQKHPISAEEYLRMGEAGVFAPDARLELIEGEIVEMAPIASPHAGCVKTLNRLFARRAGDGALISIQDPLVASALSVPQPDFLLLRPRPDNYSTSHPRAADVLLAVEVAESTLRFDLRTKAPLYARCGIAETWVVDVNDRAIHVFRDPKLEGYGTTLTVRLGERIACAMLPEAGLEVAELFPGA